MRVEPLAGSLPTFLLAPTLELLGAMSSLIQAAAGSPCVSGDKFKFSPPWPSKAATITVLALTFP